METSETFALPGPAAGSPLQPGVEVQIAGLTSRPDLEGRTGTIVEWATAEQRWRIQLHGGCSSKLLLPRHLKVSGIDAQDDVADDHRAEHAASACVTFAPEPAVAPVVVAKAAAKQRTRSGRRRPKAKPWPDGDHEATSVVPEAIGSKASAQHKHATISVDVAAPLTSSASGGVEPELPSRAEPECANGHEAQASEPTAGVEHCSMESGIVRGEGAPANISGTAIVEHHASHGLSHTRDSVLSSGDVEAPARFGVGVDAKIIGMERRPELCGKYCVLIEFLRNEGRWKVRLGDGSMKMIREDNLQVYQGDGVDGHLAETKHVASHVVNSHIDAAGLEPGLDVRIVGLQARPEMNGAGGTIVEYVQAQGRWRVQLQSGKVALLRPVNIQARADGKPRASASEVSEPLWKGGAVRIWGITSRPELNGQLATLGDRTPDGLWRLITEAGNLRLAIPAGHLEPLPAASCPPRSAPGLHAGAQVRIVGLRSRPGLNGHHGSLYGADPRSASRWNVVLHDGSGLSLDASFLEPSPLPGADAPPSERRRGELAVGARVRIVGLVSRPELDGQVGELAAHLAHELRWKVTFESGAAKVLRPENLELL